VNDAQLTTEILITFGGLFLVGLLVFTLLIAVVQVLSGQGGIGEALATGAWEIGGASLHLEELSQIGLLGAAYIGLRVVGRVLGSSVIFEIFWTGTNPQGVDSHGRNSK